MSENIKTIKFTGAICMVLAILTYIITLNIEIGFFNPGLCWISNNFALTVCGGAFASILVVLLCEVHKYRSNRLACENYLFYQAMFLYGALYYMYKNIDEYIANQNQPVPDNLVDESIMMVCSQSMALRSVDYCTFKKDNKLTSTHQEFCSNKLPKIDSIKSVGYYLKIAIACTQKRNLEQTHSQGIVTSANELVAKTLVAIRNHISPMLKHIDDYLDVIDKSCNNRYNWAKQKVNIAENYISILEAGKFEDFIKQAEAQP